MIKKVLVEGWGLLFAHPVDIGINGRHTSAMNCNMCWCHGGAHVIRGNATFAVRTIPAQRISVGQTFPNVLPHTTMDKYISLFHQIMVAVA